jgi:hypothetical protein
MERQIPRRKPRILPLVRHGKNRAAVDVLPLCVAAGLAFSGGGWRAGIAFQPAANIVFIILFAPDHSGEGLPLHQASVFVIHAGLNPA